MSSIKSISEIVNINDNYKNSINLYLDLNKTEKIDSYVPTISSLNILNGYLDSILNNKRQSTVLIGPYGKGKSILLMVLMAIISKGDDKLISRLIKKVEKVDKKTSDNIRKVQKGGKYLPVIVMGSQDDLNQTFMVALNNALKRENIQNIMPDTYYSFALDTIDRWKNDYKETYNQYIEFIKEKRIEQKTYINMLKNCDREALNIFKEIYPKLTAGSEFNPLVGGDVISMYKSVSDSLREQYGYRGIYIIFDEFSKYIESQDKEAAGNSMKVLQDLCELANDSKHSEINITLVAHKSIKEYGNHLSKEIINAYTGIEGRISEVYFVTSSKNSFELIQNAINCDTKKLNDIPNADVIFSEEEIQKSSKLPAFTDFKDDFTKIVYKGCYPLTPVTAYALLNISEKVAQNERTLFTFISSEENHSLKRFIKDNAGKKWQVGPDVVYDYFNNTFKKEIDNEFVYNEWLNADYAIKKAKTDEQKSVLKLLALINIINKPDEIDASIENLKKFSLVPDAASVIEELETNKIIYKKGSTDRYCFKTRAGIALKKELANRRKNSANITEIFENIGENQFVLPKKYNYDFSMTRYFRNVYMDVADFVEMEDISIILDNDKFQDGIVLYIYKKSNEISLKDIQAKIDKTQNERIVYVIANKIFKLDKTAIRYETLLNIKKDESFLRENEVLENELNLMIEDAEIELQEFLTKTFGDLSGATKVYFDGKKWKKTNDTAIEKIVDSVCQRIYSKTLIINNELINKQFVTTAPIKKARKIIIETLINHGDCSKFERGTSPESTIYRAVVSNSKLEEANELMTIFDEFFDECVETKNALTNLVDIYKGKGYGMRIGVLPIILAYKLSKRSEDMVVYHLNREVDLNGDAIVNMVENPDDYSLFISKVDNEKEKYLTELAELFDVNNELNLSGNRINNIVICMQRWYRSLPQVTKNIKSVSSSFADEEMVSYLPKFRGLMQSFEINPYEIIFEKLPNILKANDYSDIVSKLKKIKEALRKHYADLQAVTLDETQKVFKTKKKDSLIHTLNNWYEQQSYTAKHGLQNTVSTELMNYISNLNTYDEDIVVSNIAKIVSGSYIDVWNDGTLSDYIEKLNEVKQEIESISDDVGKGDNSKDVFYDSEGNEVDSILYHETEEGALFRGILEDHLEDFDDLDVNTKVAVLIEMINKVTKREG